MGSSFALAPLILKNYGTKKLKVNTKVNKEFDFWNLFFGIDT